MLSFCVAWESPSGSARWFSIRTQLPSPQFPVGLQISPEILHPCVAPTYIVDLKRALNPACSKAYRGSGHILKPIAPHHGKRSAIRQTPLLIGPLSEPSERSLEEISQHTYQRNYGIALKCSDDVDGGRPIAAFASGLSYFQQHGVGGHQMDTVVADTRSQLLCLGHQGRPSRRHPESCRPQVELPGG